MDSIAALKKLKPLSPLPTALSADGRLKHPVRCLMCDIYGTLLISGSGDIGSTEANRQKLENLRTLLFEYAQPIEPEMLLEQLKDAIAREHARAIANGIDFPEVRIENIWEKLLFGGNRTGARSFAMEFEILMNPVWPMPGLAELLDVCRRGSIRVGIVSNAQFYTPVILKYFMGCNLQSAGFQPGLMFFSFKHGFAKPSRHLFLAAASRLHGLGISPRQVAYIGNDMYNDILPAHLSGFQTILFAGDGRSLRLRKDISQCAGIEPGRIITRLEELTQELGAYGQ